MCVNSIGSFSCHCIKGFILNITSGCNAIPGMCPDGTMCDKNAVCKHSEGSQVRIFMIFNDDPPSESVHFKRKDICNCFRSIGVFVESVLVVMVTFAHLIAI